MSLGQVAAPDLTDCDEGNTLLRLHTDSLRREFGEVAESTGASMACYFFYYILLN